MATKRQIAANQANARRSTGPRTTEGKQRVRLNGFRHGLTANAVVMHEDDRAAYLAHCQALFDHYKPIGPLETHLAQQIADAQWRLNRAACYESTLFALGGYRRESKYNSGDHRLDNALAQAEALASIAPTLANLSLYEQRLTRQMEKNMALFKEVQYKRQWEEWKAERERRDNPSATPPQDAPKDPSKDPRDDDRPDSDAALRPENASSTESSADEEIGFGFSSEESAAAIPPPEHFQPLPAPAIWHTLVAASGKTKPSRNLFPSRDEREWYQFATAECTTFPSNANGSAL